MYDESLAVLRRSLDSARLGHTEKLDGFRRLDQLVRKVEAEAQPQADFAQVVAHERGISRELGGRTAHDDRRDAQMRLF